MTDRTQARGRNRSGSLSRQLFATHAIFGKELPQV